jgi:DNA-binding transcriptional MocR family regulator
MPSYLTLSSDQIKQELAALETQYQNWAAQKRQLNMTRGKPCAAQLDLVSGLATCLEGSDYRASDGTDCRNYGGLDGLPEARALFADLLGLAAEHVMVLGNSSLNLMYDMMVRAMLFALPGADKPWSQAGPVRFLCPVPGYDRHFTVTQSLGIEMIPVPMTPSGPDMDVVESLVAQDSQVKGIWCVPVYSNPDGITYTAETCRRLSSMATAAPDFRIFWDNAYVVHHFDPAEAETTPEILALCAQAGHPDRVLAFASTSKITWAGSGIACLAASPANLAFVRRHMSAQTIGPDKMSQLRHVRFLKDKTGVLAIMARHGEILRPKFDLVLDLLAQELADCGICHWKRPRGGYFISLFVMPGTAAETVRLAKACGVEVTPAGSTWPYGRDPEDSNIRLAPSFPTTDELRTAILVLTVCIRLAALRRLLPEPAPAPKIEG